MNREECLDKCKEIVMGARQENYGSPEDNFRRIADLWTDYLNRDIEPHDVAIMMILMKAARLMNNPSHLDSWIDIAGYAANGCELTTGKNSEGSSKDAAEELLNAYIDSRRAANNG